MLAKTNRVALQILLAGALSVVGIGSPPYESSGLPDAMAAEKSVAANKPDASNKPDAAKTKKRKRRPSAANSFNRLMKKPEFSVNARPSEDGIHDPGNAGTNSLQWPSEAFRDLPKSPNGNRVDWVKALREGLIAPRYELDDPNAEVFKLDLVIVREVKGSMPNVVFPHLAHTEWLDCSNCHDEIFIPQKGANQVSMAAILLGQKCGVCHGSVAFPVSDCRRCHAQPKTAEQLRALAQGSAWRSNGKAASRKRDRN